MTDKDTLTAEAAPAESETTRIRRLSGGWKALLIVWTLATLFLCINQQFTLRFFVGFTMLNTEYYYLLVLLLLPLVFILFPGSQRAPLDRVPWYDTALLVITTGVGIHLMLYVRQAAAMGWERGGAPDELVWSCYAMWALLMEALRRTGGMALMLSILPFSLYPLFAGWMPRPFTGDQTDIVETASFHMLSSESLLGIALQSFAEIVIGFLVFGAALQFTGAGRFFIDLAFALTGRFRGGAAKTCIFASGLLGMMSGSIIGNVLTAGTMTIPAMKKSGFPASYSGAIEACASTGAVLAPPVMGATAFVMAQFLGVGYAEVALAAAIPALLYYFGLFMQVDSYAARRNMKGLEPHEIPNLLEVMKKGWYFIFVIALLVFMLLIMKRESHAPFYATALLLVLNQLFSDKRWGLKELVAFIEMNGRLFVELVGILAGVGLLIGAFSITGLTSTLTNEILLLAGGSVFVLLLLGAVTSFILGLGLTTTPCYIFLAILLAPALEKAGLNKMAVHMFVFYWGMLSSITPPVAIASFAAASIAGAPAMKTSWESMWVGSIIYFIPFFFVFNPAYVLEGPLTESLYLTVTTGLGIVAICGGLQGYQVFAGNLNRTGNLEWLLRGLLVIGGFGLAMPGGGLTGYSTNLTTIIGLAILVPTLIAARVLIGRSHPTMVRA
ncbi:TRAP transporter permease [Desertibaculum subflavum]|uniref:TRAP transporter permease n=1 Tax=Desertibaculum subflavum TaxID=2268458 RepID=UPI000E670C6D